MDSQQVEAQDGLAAILGLGTEQAPAEDAVESQATEADEEVEVPEGEDHLEEMQEEDAEPTSTWEPMTIVADGVESTVEDRDTAIRLMQLGKTFTVRNERLVERERELEPLKQQLSAQLNQYATALPHLEQMLQQQAGPRPTRDQFGTDNEWLVADRLWQDRQADVQAVQAEQQRVNQIRQQEMTQARDSWREQQRTALAQKLPEWSDDAVARLESEEIRAYLTSVGVDYEGLVRADSDLLWDHTFILMARDAMRFRKLDTKGKEVVKKGPKTAAPAQGDRPRTGKNRKRKEQWERFQQTGRLKDGEPLLGELLGLS